jgi:acid phosphatase class B
MQRQSALVSAVPVTSPASVTPLPASHANTCKTITIFSDVDDTIWAAGKNFIAGVDSSYPSKTIYFGISQFYVELARGKSGSNSPDKVVLLSARPKEIVWFPGIGVDLHSSTIARAFQAAGKNSGVPFGLKDAMYGSITSNFHIHEANRFKDYAKDKVKAFMSKFNSIPAGTCFIFSGDNGQGDLLAGVQMLQAATGAKAQLLPAVFIHKVTDSPKVDMAVGPGTPIYFYKTAPDAAVLAYKRGLISLDGVKRVIAAVENDPNYKSCSASGCKDLAPALAAAKLVK